MSETVFTELLRYVQFGDEDRAALSAFADRARPHFVRIADRFYARLSEHAEAAAVFTGQEQIDRLKSTLIGWMELLLTGPWNADYFDLRRRIGAHHVRIKLPQRYMFGAMAQIRGDLGDLARSSVGGSVGAAVVRALEKLLDVELGVMLESYHDEYVAEVQRAERLEAELLTQRLTERTLRAERLAALGTMAAGLAHEVRNPLNAAQLQLTLLQRRLARAGGPDVGGAAAAATLVSDELRRLAVLVDEVLQYARPQPLRPTRMDLAASAQAIVSFLRPEAEKAGVDLSLQAEKPVPAQLDDERIKQVLLNLARNAVEATGAGGRVMVRVATEADRAVCEVEDDGPGLPSTDAPIFEPFFTTKPHGTGLGLAVVHRVVNDHGGMVQVESRPGRTLFRVILPRGRDA